MLMISWIHNGCNTEKKVTNDIKINLAKAELDKNEIENELYKEKEKIQSGKLMSICVYIEIFEYE